MNLFERFFVGLDGKNIFRTLGCFYAAIFLINFGFWGLVIWALIKYIKS